METKDITILTTVEDIDMGDEIQFKEDDPDDWGSCPWLRKITCHACCITAILDEAKTECEATLVAVKAWGAWNWYHWDILEDVSEDRSLVRKQILTQHGTLNPRWVHPGCYFQGNPMQILEDILIKTKEDFSPYLLYSHRSVI